ncbi:MAG: thioredoxin domain-containing protein [Deltaproteobacteria bacterium]|nr:thioredoxin domain-containing protein [Deltaproteobacteria bacterium]
MKFRLVAVLSMALMATACGKKDEKPVGGEQVAPAAAEGEGAAKGGEAAVGGAEKAAEAPAGAADRGAAPATAGGALAPASTNAPNAKVEIIEFSDFQCPFCSRVIPTVKQIEQTYGDSVKVTFLHQPLSFHQNAMPAATAAVAAMKQGKFWEMHDKLFANQSSLNQQSFESWAKELGLDVEQFKKDMADPATKDFIEKNQAIAMAVGATGTPSFFINGKSLRGAQPFEQFKAVIDEEIKAADDAGKTGAEWLKTRTQANNAALYDYVYNNKAPAKQAPPPPRVDRTVYKVDVDTEKDAIKGNKDGALVTIVEFSEFQCPFCSKVKPTIDQLLTDYGDKVRLVFKHNPLPFHNNALPASNAALCAQEQGKFWEMYDKLFENQRALEAADLEKYATEVGVDVAKWKQCFESKKYQAKIEADQELAGKVTARGTPNVFINGRKVTGAKPIEEFKSVVDEELTKAQALAAKGTPPGQKLYEELVKDGQVFEPLEAQVNEFKLDDSPTKGKAGAKIQIVEFSDFQCPFCSRVSAPLGEVKAHYGDDVAITFKHFPLSFHQNAMPAAIAAMCAHEQGKFWEFHDLAFANQKALSADDLNGYAKQVGLDEKKFSECVAANKPKAKIEADMAEARAAGVRGTPTIYINGRKFNSPSGYSLDAFTGVIDKYILKK